MALGITHSVAQMGILEWLKNPIDNIVHRFEDTIEVLSNLGNLIVTSISYVVSALAYIIQIGFFWLIDFVQTVFRRIAGLDTYWFKNGTSLEAQSGDIVESLLISDTVWTVFSSVLIAAIILLFVATIIAILKTELNEKDNAKGPVIKQALKAIAYFVLVPVVCILGVTLANIFLRTFDGATSRNGAVSISGEVFSAASYNANRVRNGQNIIGDKHDDTWGDWATTKQRLAYIPNLKITKSSSQADIANAIDNAFLHTMWIDQSKKPAEITDSSFDPTKYEYSYDGYMAGYAFYFYNSDTEYFSTFDKNDVVMTYIYYDLLQYNWLIGYLGSFTIIMLLLSLMIGVVQRMFDLTVLFIVSPAFIALMPLDNGSRYGKWRDEFVKRTIACYGPIVGINLAFTVLTLAQQIYIFNPSEPMAGLYNALMQCIFVITAILCVKDFGKLINSIVGGSDLNENKASDVAKTVGKLAGAGASVAAFGAKTAGGVAASAIRSGKSWTSARFAGIKNWRAEGKIRKSQKALDDREANIDNEVAERINSGDAETEFLGKLTPGQRVRYGGLSAARKKDALERYTRNSIQNEIKTQRDEWRVRDDARKELYESSQRKRKAEKETERQHMAEFADKTIAGGYGLTHSLYKTSGVGDKFKDFREAGGTQALEDIATTTADVVTAPIRKGYKYNDKGEVTGVRPDTADVIKKTRQFLGTESGKKASDKDKEKKQKQADTEALAKAIAKAIADKLGTP